MKRHHRLVFIVVLSIVIAGGALAVVATCNVSNAPQAIRLSMEGGFDPASNHLVPGGDIDQGFTITLEAGNPPCWIFFELTPSENSSAFFSYQIGEGWQKLPGYPYVYYRHVDAQETPTIFDPLVDDCIHVLESLTAPEMIDLINTTGPPSIGCSVFAIQSEGFTPELAWAQHHP